MLKHLVASSDQVLFGPMIVLLFSFGKLFETHEPRVLVFIAVRVLDESGRVVIGLDHALLVLQVIPLEG